MQPSPLQPHEGNATLPVTMRTITAKQHQHPAERPRLFIIEYDNSKMKTANPTTRERFKEKLTLWGAVWPSTDGNPAGGVSLSNGVHFLRMDELEEHFERAGEYHIRWEDES